MLHIRPYYESPVHSNLTIQTSNPQEISIDDTLKAKAAIKEVFKSYGLSDENLLPSVAFENLPPGYLGLYHISNHLIKIDVVETDSIVRTTRHEAVHAVFGVLKQKVLLENPELYKKKMVDGLINVFRNPPGGFFLTKDYELIKPKLSENMLAKVKLLLLDSNLNLLDYKLVAKILQEAGLQLIEAHYMADLAAITISPMQMKAELKEAINSLKLTRKQLDLALRSIEEYPKFNSTLEKDDYISNPTELNFLAGWFSITSWRIWKSNICSEESKKKSEKEYLKNLEEIVARLYQLPLGETKDKLFYLAKVYRSRSNPVRRLRLIEDIKNYTQNITDDENLKCQFELLIEKLKEDTLEEIKKTTVFENHQNL